MDLLGRRRSAMVGADKLFGYIADGLALFLDGINKGGTDGNWTDLVAGHVFTNYGATALADGWSFDGDAYMLNATFERLLAADGSQLEIVFEAQNTNCILFVQQGSPTGRSLAAGITSRGDSLVTSIKATGIPLAYNGEKQASIGSTLASSYLEGSPAEPGGNSTYYSYNGVNSSIGRRNQNSDYRPFVGIIRAIRLYNRSLTAEEVAHNYAIDAKRFNL